MAELHMKLLVEKERLEAESLELQWKQSKMELARMKRQEKIQRKIHQRQIRELWAEIVH
jgi:hypothetical protein